MAFFGVMVAFSAFSSFFSPFYVYCVLVAVLVSFTSALAQYSTADCSSLTSCSPDACKVNTEADCSFNTRTPEWAAALAAMTCKTCTQSTASKCSNLASTLKTAGGKIQAAYCNDEYLVIAADGLPSNYDAAVYLKGVPLPPGGDSTCRVRTAAQQMNVYKIPLNPTKHANPTSQASQNPLPGVSGMPAAGAVAVAIDGIPMFPNCKFASNHSWRINN